MKFKQLQINVTDLGRGSTHGYTAFDYARDTAEFIRLRESDNLTWLDDCQAHLYESKAVDIVQNIITNEDPHISELLSYEIVTLEIG